MFIVWPHPAPQLYCKLSLHMPGDCIGEHRN